MADNYILTPEGKQQLEEELHYLETEKSAEVGERIKVAREFGDISENSEYDDAKNEQGMLEARIAEITRILGEATVVATPKRSNSVHIGSTVTVDMDGRERVFTIVGAAEADSHAGKISNESPVGRCAAGPQEGRRDRDHRPDRPRHQDEDRQYRALANLQVPLARRQAGLLDVAAVCAALLAHSVSRTWLTGPCSLASAESGAPQPLSLTQPNPCT